VISGKVSVVLPPGNSELKLSDVFGCPSMASEF